MAALALGALLIALALHAVVPPPARAVAARTTLPAVESQAMCVTCKIPLTVAQSPQADRERAFIARLIDAGLTEAQIKRALVREYGPAVLALPRAHGFGLAVYLVPPAWCSRCSACSRCCYPAGGAAPVPPRRPAEGPPAPPRR